MREPLDVQEGVRFIGMGGPRGMFLPTHAAEVAEAVGALHAPSAKPAGSPVTEVVAINPCSVEMKMSASGFRYWDIKVYLPFEKIMEAPGTIEAIDKIMRERFG